MNHLQIFPFICFAKVVQHLKYFTNFYFPRQKCHVKSQQEKITKQEKITQQENTFLGMKCVFLLSYLFLLNFYMKRP